MRVKYLAQEHNAVTLARARTRTTDLESSALTIRSLHLPNDIKYHIFSIKRPRHLFQNLRCGPGVYLKLALNWVPAFISEVQFSEFLSD